MRFQVTYTLPGPEPEARYRAEDICVEQTVEFPPELLPPGPIRNDIVGRVEALQALPSGRYAAVISFDVQTAGRELTQLLNVIWGNISLKPGVRLERLALPTELLADYHGPRFGVAGVRQQLQAPGRPLLCTALKPMGLSPAELARQAYLCARGGIDLIKDDHGLADQVYAPFQERVRAVVAAVARANAETDGHALYLPNITGPAEQMLLRAELARDAGAGGLLIAPALAGFDTMRHLADHAGLPVMSHPAFLGSYVTTPDMGISHYALFGQIMRLAGADISVYPNWGGRFGFSQQECQEIAAGCSAPLGALKPILPAPGGGMNLQRVPEMLAVYGNDVILLIGGGLHQAGPDLAANAAQFRAMVER